MDKEIIKTALNNALYLLNSELESVSMDELREQYLSTIADVELGLAEIEG